METDNNTPGADSVEQIRQERNQEPAAEPTLNKPRQNFRWLFLRDEFFDDLLMEQQEQ
jgi:hypothetical protein